MASAAYVKSLFGNTDAGVRRAMSQAADHMLTGLAFGHVGDQERAENFRGHYHTFTTPSTGDVEFSIAHGLGVTPYALIPVLPLDVVGARTVRLEVTRLPDSQRVYLRSPETDVTGYVLIEG